MSERVVGFQDGKDVSYCILENGIPIIHEEKERFNRVKDTIGDGLGFFFDYCGRTDIKYFTLGNPGGRDYLSRRGLDKEGAKYFERMQNIIKENDGKYYVPGHHQSHAAGAFYSSNFKDALVITLDGEGQDKVDQYNYDDINTGQQKVDTAFTIWRGKDTKLDRILLSDVRDFSIGWPWYLATEKIFGLSVGEPIGNQAGTVMAMGTMGDPDKYFDVFYGKAYRNPSVNWQYYHNLAKTDEQESFDIAAGLQRATEVMFREQITPFVEEYDGENICFSGGASLNSVMMGKIIEWFPKIKNLHHDPVPYDGGLSLGAARYVWHHILDNPRIEWEDNSSPYLGRTYGEDEINKAIKKYTEE